ncbi:MAG: polysulfide reductase NrfD [Ignavibacteriaceae bacterium]
MSVDYSKEIPLVQGRLTMAELDEAIAKPMSIRPGKIYFIALAFTSGLLLLGVLGVSLTFYFGIGEWGNNQPVAWGWGITNFVFWVGIAHAGTLISAILYLLRQKWRTGISRFAEAMTIFAVMCAGIFPIIHTGRPWLAGYLLPYPNSHHLWPNFISPLVWDVFAVSTYLIVSAIFWYVGLIPDFATLRDRAVSKIKKFVYSLFSLGWRHSNRHWRHYEKVYMILAGLATPLVLSVHTVVSFDFAVAVLPGWHSTIFPPYFVAGAIFSGFAMVVTALVFMRKVLGLENVITIDHLDRMNKIILLTGSMVGYAYLMEFFISLYSGVPTEQYVAINRAFGEYAWGYWIMVTCNSLFPQLFWFRKFRRSIPAMFIVVVLVNVGMWFERFIIIASSLHRDFLPSSWGYFTPTWVDFSILLGSFGLFFTLVLLFSRTLPVVTMSEIKGVVEGAHPTHHGGDHDG